jgi:NAD-dependent dihydropyrimidine dehydrogenase PreA subunit
MKSITVDHDKCTLCQTCISLCPMGVYEVVEGKITPINIDLCLVCRACEAACPVEAITVRE